MLFAFVVDDDGGEITRTVKINITIKRAAVERCKIVGIALRDVRISVEFSNNRTIFAFNQAVIITVLRSRFSEFNM